MSLRLVNLTMLSALGASLVACSADSTSPSNSAAGSVSLSFAATGANTSSSSLSGGTFSGALVSSSASSDVLVITKAELVLAELELQRAGGSCADTTSSSSDSCEELELAPTKIDLAVNGNVISALTVPVPPGSYSALEAKITLADTGRSGGAALIAANPQLRGASVHVEGTFNGQAFVYTGTTRAQIESRFEPPLVADGSGINVTVSVDLTNWFKTSAGALIDPSTANAGGPNAELVSTNIARSFIAFRDDDRDGRDDSGAGSGR